MKLLGVFVVSLLLVAGACTSAHKVNGVPIKEAQTNTLQCLNDLMAFSASGDQGYLPEKAVADCHKPGVNISHECLASIFTGWDENAPDPCIDKTVFPKGLP